MEPNDTYGLPAILRLAAENDRLRAALERILKDLYPGLFGVARIAREALEGRVLRPAETVSDKPSDQLT